MSNSLSFALGFESIGPLLSEILAKIDKRPCFGLEHRSTGLPGAESNTAF
jgi:hypothetical protein